MATKAKSAKPVKIATRSAKTTRATKATKTTKAIEGTKNLPNTPRKWDKCHKRFIVPELLRRGLPTWGHYSSLINRLKATDAPTLRTPEGRKAAHARKLKRLQNAALKAGPHFPLFSKLPLEIREQIWELSLPGPRVLTLDTGGQPPVPERLWFSRTYRWRNPAALKTCRESRTVALRRYRLAFGTPNVYFDFEGGDILYWGPECRTGIYLGHGWQWEEVPPVSPEEEVQWAFGKLNDEVRSDLESVRHLAISRERWDCPCPQYTSWFHGLGGQHFAKGHVLRRKLRKFKALERISLEHGRERLKPPFVEQVFYGGSVIEDPLFQEKPRDWTIEATEGGLAMEIWKQHLPRVEEWLERDGKWEITGDRNAFMLLCRFDMEDLSEEEMEKGIPEARLVDIKFVADEPRIVREDFVNEEPGPSYY